MRRELNEMLGYLFGGVGIGLVIGVGGVYGFLIFCKKDVKS